MGTGDQNLVAGPIQAIEQIQPPLVNQQTLPLHGAFGAPALPSS